MNIVNLFLKFLLIFFIVISLLTVGVVIYLYMITSRDKSYKEDLKELDEECDTDEFDSK